MNHLIHTYLSSANPQEQAGNFAADWIKGNKLDKYPPDIQRGIRLHRFIDSYSDKHPAVRTSKLRLRQCYGKYAGVAVDVVYDHFLAASWSRYSQVTLPQFICELEKNLNENIHLFPSEAQQYFARFMKYRWLESYSTLDGIGRVLFAMSYARNLPPENEAALAIVKDNYSMFAEEFKTFFVDLSEAVP